MISYRFLQTQPYSKMASVSQKIAICRQSRRSSKTEQQSIGKSNRPNIYHVAFYYFFFVILLWKFKENMLIAFSNKKLIIEEDCKEESKKYFSREKEFSIPTFCCKYCKLWIFYYQNSHKNMCINPHVQVRILVCYEWEQVLTNITRSLSDHNKIYYVLNGTSLSRNRRSLWCLS
jgi:hypothetical protein